LISNVECQRSHQVRRPLLSGFQLNCEARVDFSTCRGRRAENPPTASSRHIALVWLGADIAFVEIGTLGDALELEHRQENPYQHHGEHEHTNEKEARLIHDCRAPLTASLK
jgi:hypothetical protein